MILWTLRHTTPDVPKGVCYGRSDYDVASTFDTEYPPALRALEDCTASLIHSSPLQRCHKLAQKVAGHLHLPVEITPELAEIHFGTWERRPFNAIPEEEKAAWRANLRHYRFPDGESFHDVEVRVTEFLLRCHAQKKETLWVTHAGVIAALLHSFAGIPDEEFIEGKLGYGTLLRFDFTAWSPSSPSAVPWEMVYKGVPQPHFG